MRPLNLTNQVFGRLTAIKVARKSNKRAWLCMCECGNSVVVLTGNLTNGSTVSCGCKKKEGNVKHGMTGTSLYTTWCGMKQRCYDENSESYKNYGGRGITVCDEWRDSFVTFRDDMGIPPSSSHTLDRIDNDKNYSKLNCKWSTRTEQNINSRPQSNNTSGTKGVTWHKTKKRWVASICKNGKRYCLGYFKNKEDAIKARKVDELKYHTY